ncbi:DNA primase [Bacteroidia bacterium]|nr:DNA primase [Bacteroidia bacterium]
MDSKIINQFPIRDYLAGSGIYPTKDNGFYGMYYSPFREDRNASMKVDYNKNLWIDYGTGEGGTLIDLVMRIENCSNGRAMQLLEQKIAGTASFSFQKEEETVPKIPQQQTISIQKIDVLTNPSLLAYLNERSINIDIAQLYCKEIHYSVNDKPYFAVGFRNDNEGYELRNRYFKGCTSKDTTTIKAGSNNNTCQLFEGFMDYFSFLTMKNWQQSKADVIVLNSLTNLVKIKNALTVYESIATFLDNDEAGKRAVQELKSCYPNVTDQSEFYARHKDLNEYLCSKKQLPQKQIRKGFKL